MLKRSFDLLLALLALLALLPLLVAVAVVIKVHDGGPIFYRGERVGRGGRPFRMWKFRTMVAGADRGASSTPDDDPRLTAWGRRLRRCKLDELPQLWNVLCGHMSLVGPRPQVAWAVQRYTLAEKIVLQVRPGITDLASLHFHDEGARLRHSLQPDLDYFATIHPVKMQLARHYVQHQSFWLDLNILWRTLLQTVRLFWNAARPPCAPLKRR